MKKIILLLTIVMSQGISAQGFHVVSSRDSARKFTLSGFADLYMGYQLGGKKQKEDFYYNHKVNNRLRTNLLLIKCSYESPRFHAVLGLMTGDYSKYNLAAEPNWAKPLNEAYLGVRLSKHQNIWWDAGVYSSFLGIESSVSSDCPTLTRSIVAENSPYYLSGTRLLYTSKNTKHEAGLHVLNGWQRIGWDPKIKRPSFGAHYKYRCRENLSLMYGVFYGSVYPDSLGIQRLYHHVNANWKKGKWELWGTLDLGTESGSLWGAAQVMGQCTLSPRWSLTQRLEVYYDPDNRCARVGANKETIIGGYALGGNFNLGKNILIRLEPKILLASEEILKGERTMLHLNAGIGMRF
jgi:hypothetical protein